MNTFYLSPSGFSYNQYCLIVSSVLAFGWSLSYAWPRYSFSIDYTLKSNTLKKVIRALSRTDIYIATIPGTCSSLLEIGLAYSLCEEVFLAARNLVHFTQTGLSDAYLAELPSIKKVCCEINDIPFELKKEYLYLLDTKQRSSL